MVKKIYRYNWYFVDKFTPRINVVEFVAEETKTTYRLPSLSVKKKYINKLWPNNKSFMFSDSQNNLELFKQLIRKDFELRIRMLKNTVKKLDTWEVKYNE